MNAALGFSLIGLSLAIVCTTLAAIIFRVRSSRLHSVWMLFNVTVALWGWGSFLIGRVSSPPLALFLWKLAYIPVTFIAVFFFHFIYEFCRLRSPKLLSLIYLQGALTFIGLFTNIFIEKVNLIFSNLYYAYLTVYGRIALSIWIIIVVYGHYNLILHYVRSRGKERLQSLYFLVGMVVGFIFGLTNFFPALGLNFYPFGNIGVLVYCLIVTYAILRHHLLDVRVTLTRAGIFLVLYTLILGLPFYFGYRTKSWLISTSFAVVLASIGPLIYRYLQSKAEAVLLSEQRHYQKILVQAAGGMTREHNLDKLCKLIVYIVKRTIKNTFAAIVVNDRIQKTYSLRAVRDSGKSIGDFNFTPKHPFVNYLRKVKEPILYDELPAYVRKSFRVRSRIDLIVPSYTEGKLLGFLLLGGKMNRHPYTPDDINIFKILSHQTALAIENCIFFEEFKEAQERIFTAEKLASIGGMADGVAHQIKNRLNHFSVASGEMRLEIEDFIKKNPELVEKSKDLQETFEYLKKITDSLVTNVKRTDGVVKGILNFARTEEKDKYFSSFPFRDLIEQSLELLSIKHQVSPFPLELDADPNATVYGVKSQLKEVIYNILDNDFEATEEKRKYHLTDKERFEFKPSIKLKLSDMHNFQLIEISDNGIGIKEESQDKIFAPFFTTKSSYKSGSGIGMYVVRRIIEENHGGKIWFESTYMEGTKFFIRLPKKGQGVA